MVNEDLITAELREYVRRYVLWHYRSLRDRGMKLSVTRNDLLSAANEGICDAALWFDRTKSDVSKFKYVVKNYVRSKIKMTLGQFQVWENMSDEEDDEVKASEEFGGDAIISEEVSEEEEEVVQRVRKGGKKRASESHRNRRYQEMMEEGLLGHTFDNFYELFAEEMGIKKEDRRDDDDSDVQVVFTPFNDEIYEVPEMSEEEIEEDEMKGEEMDRMLGCLTAREKRVIGSLYGLPGYEEMKISEVARMEGISIYQVKQVVEEAERKMREFCAVR